MKSTTKSGKPGNGYLVPYADVPTQLCSPHDFRQKILGENGQYESLVIPNSKSCGIPQGAPNSDLLANLYLIDFDVEMNALASSDLLANLYLIDFDVEMNALASSVGGSYVRYSDSRFRPIKRDR